MNHLLRLLSYILFLSLCACAHPPKTFFKLKVISPCQAMCVQRFESCSQLCTNNCTNCFISTMGKAGKNYRKYVHEKQVDGGSIMRGLKSYRDPLQCRKVTCNCRADLLLCKQSCTGIIRKRLEAIPQCS